MSATIRWTTFFVLGCVALCVSGLLANPSHRQFDAALAVHGKKFSPELQKKAQSLYDEANKALLRYVENVKNQRVGRLDPKALGRTHVELTQLQRLADQLRVLGEPAGVDFANRAGAMHGSLGGCITAYKGLPEAQRFIESVRIQLKKHEPVRMKVLVRLRELVAEQKWQQGESVLDDLFDTLQPGTVFLSPEENRVIYEPFNQVSSAIRMAMSRIRTTTGRNLLLEARQEQTPDFTAILGEINAALASLATTGAALWSGETLAGPQLVAGFGRKWQDVQVAVLRCRALDAALRDRYAMYEEGSPVMPGAPQADKLEADYGQFSAALVQAITQAIAADTARVSAEQAPGLYVEYLRALAPLARRSAGRSLAPAVEPALDKLAAKTPLLAAEVAAYRTATIELMRWRERVATARAAQRAAQYPLIEQRFFTATKSEGPYIGLFPERNPNPMAPALLAAAPAIMPPAIQRLMGQPVSAADVVRLPGDSKAAIAAYRGRAYVNVPAPLDLAAEIDALRFDLLVSEQTPPLTLATMQAVTSAERGDLAAVGGEISGAYLEAVITRFATLPPAAAVLVPLGALPREETDGPGWLSQVMMRFDLAPRWARHEQFFVEFAAAKSAGTGAQESAPK